MTNDTDIVNVLFDAFQASASQIPDPVDIIDFIREKGFDIVRVDERSGFVDGLVAIQNDDAALERACAEFYGEPGWSARNEKDRAFLRNRMRATLTAAAKGGQS